MNRVVQRGVILLALLAGLTHAQSTDAPPPAGSTVAEGRRVYVRSCEVCHGPAGAGALGPALKRVGQRLSAQQLEEQIKNPKGSMPRLYPAAVSAEDVDRLVAYLHQL